MFQIKTLLETQTTMTSIQLFDMLDNFKELKSLHQAIRRMFQDNIDNGSIKSSLNPNGTVAYYTLPEIESKMFVASRDIKYLEQITKYWINSVGNKPMTRLEAAKHQVFLIEELEAEEAAIFDQN